LTNFLELFLHLPGIDVNKADNEGNTPLHFASQAGRIMGKIVLLRSCEWNSHFIRNQAQISALHCSAVAYSESLVMKF
jgi:ankyrin repeat protein